MLRRRGGSIHVENFIEHLVTGGQIRVIGDVLSQELLQRRIIVERFVHLRIAAPALGAEPDQFGHILVNGDQLPGPVDDGVFFRRVTTRHGPR